MCVYWVLFLIAVTEEDSDALEKVLLDNKIEGFALTGERTYEKVVHHLRELGHDELAEKLRLNLDKGGYTLKYNLHSLTRV